MKRFDRGYIYSSLISDLFTCLVISFVFFNEFFLSEEATVEDIVSAVPIFAAVFAVIYLCFVAYRIMYYRTSGYELTATEIRCNRGVFFRKRSVLDYKKVNAINKKQSIFHMIFGIAVLTVDSGSTNTAHQAEITIVEKSATVDALLKELNALKAGGARASANSSEEVLLSEGDSLYRFTSKKKMLYTLINIATTAFFTVLFGVLASVVIGACKLVLQLDVLGTWGEYFLYTVSIMLGAVLLLSAFSFIGCMLQSFVGYHDFTIKKLGGDIQISFGLLERHTNTFSYDKIKAVKISQGLVQRMLGFAAIKLEVIGYTNESGNNNNDAEIGILVPFCKYDEVGEILGKVLPDFVPDEKQTKSASYFPFVSWFFLILGIVTGLVLIQAVLSMLIFEVSATVIAAVAFAIAGVGAIILAVKALHAALGYQNSGIAAKDGKITAYYGGFTKNITVFMAKNLIAAESVTTPLRQKAGIASLVMHIKTNASSNEIKVHVQKDSLSEEIEKLLIL